MLYYNSLESIKNKNIIFRISIALRKYPIFFNKTKSFIFRDYFSEKYYFLNKIIIDWTKFNYNQTNQYIFINDFNNLHYDDNLGYANINSFSKALYDQPLLSDSYKNLNINHLKNHSLVLIQAHVYYIDLIKEIINKANNIPVPFDLYTTANTQDKKNYIENYLKINSNANKYEIFVKQNKGRDVIPFLIQLKDILMKYKYLCHIHTKKHDDKKKLGKYWQKYLYENLLGNKIIIKTIVSDFENNNKLEFFF